MPVLSETTAPYSQSALRQAMPILESNMEMQQEIKKVGERGKVPENASFASSVKLIMLQLK